MPKKTCPNGHVYDPSIYGDQCPLCPPGVSAPAGAGPATHLGSAPSPAPVGGMHTHIAGSVPPPPGFGGAGIPPQQTGQAPANDASGATKMRPQEATPHGGGHTVIRRPDRRGNMAGKAPMRKLVGFLVTYNRDPNGRAFNIYEGRNFIGRDESCDICIPDDDQMSGRHLSILYRNVDNKFKFRDEQSSNGTFVNKELLDDGTLENYDIIRAGSTLFIFIAIPNFS